MRRPRSATNGLVAKLLDHAAANPIKVLSVAALLFGGLLLLVYFARIEFLPDINLEAAPSLLYATALMGLLIVSFAAASMVMPGLLLAYWRDDAAESHFSDVLIAAALNALTWGVALSWLFGQLGGITALCITAALWCASMVLWVRWIASRQPRASGFYRHALNRLGARWLLPAAFSALLMVTPVAFIFAFGLRGDIVYASNAQAIGRLVLLVLAASTVFISLSQSGSRIRTAAFLAALLLFLVFAATGSFSAASVMVVGKLGLGEYTAVRAVVSGKTCRQINLALGQAVCRETADEDATVICPAVLRSRIGSQALLEFAAMSIERSGTNASLAWQSIPEQRDKPVHYRRVVLDKAQLLTWSSVPLALSPMPAGPTPAPVILASALTDSGSSSGIEEQPLELRTALAQVCKPPFGMP
ncbi:hypothetical protein ASD88_11740 [Pelomonas sp. Root662]|nr:hypothetical protein ASC81_11740 [Pelomonas sp. Root405]KRA72411.1 hypothetical protein ASD88_11740 [Pelomonas sp. Root662]